MASDRIVHKHLRLDQAKLKRAQKALSAATETVAVERALDLAISEHERSRIVAAANRQFLRSGIAIRDVLGGRRKIKPGVQQAVRQQLTLAR
jgi:hypothetical protein